MESLGQARDIAAGKSVPGAVIREYAITEAREFRSKDIKRIRKRLNFTQEMLAQFLGVSLGSVRHWEQGRTSPLGPSRRLLEALDESAADLLGVYERMKIIRLPEHEDERTGTGG